jgi:phytoene synthase
VARALACILGLTHSAAGAQFSTLGKAIRLTYILRDIAGDWKRGRLFLPLEDLARFRYSERDLSGQVVNTSFRELLRFEIDRARGLFKEGSKGIRWLGNDGGRVAVSMTAAWHLGLLDAIERREDDLFTRTVELSFPQRVAVLPRAWKLARSAIGD